MLLWEGRRREHQGTFDGRRKWSDRIHPTHWFRKGKKTLEHKLFVGPMERRTRELQYHKVNGSDNGADLFSKAFAHDSVMRHTEAMGGVFMFGKTLSHSLSTTYVQT